MKDFRHILDDLGKVLESVPWENRRAYGMFLSQTYHYSRHTTRILSLAASKFSVDSVDMHQRFIKHANEELNQEKRLDSDLKNLGFTSTDFKELPATRAFYLAHYQTIELDGPWSLLGYIIALEGLGIERGDWLFQRIKKHHGERAASFIKLQAHDGIARIEESRSVLDILPPAQRPAMLRHLETTAFLYRAIINEVIHQAGVGTAAEELAKQPGVRKYA